MAFPKKVAIYTASFENIGEADETLKVVWNYPDPPNNPGNRSFIVGTHCFLESPANTSQVPDEHLLASLGMMAILAGGVLPGTQEYIDAVTNQETMNFQTIIGNVKLKTSSVSDPNPKPVIDPTYGPTGAVFDVTFVKVGTTSNQKVVRTDAWSICQYDNRADNASIPVECIPGALHKEFGFKKSELGAAGSANRNAIIAWVATRLFWV